MTWSRLPAEREALLRSRLPALPPLQRIRVRPGLPWWVRLAPIPVGAIAFPRTIYGVTLPEPEDLAGWERLVHELCHVDQWRRLGRVRFLLRYLGAYLRNRASGMGALEAYLRIPLEMEARAVAAELRRAVEGGN